MSDNELRDQNKKKYDKNLQRINEITKQIIEGGWDNYYKNEKI
jgi:hypothetical protein